MPAWGVAAMLAGGDRALGRAALAEVRALPRAVLAARLASAFTATADELGPLLAAPLLAVLGLRDRLVSPARARAILRGVASSTVVDLDAPHLVVQTKPAAVWEAISDEFESAA
jgi:pimeloyl-ACP methyl ester carboxylesterase